MKKNTPKNIRHKQSFHSHALRESENGAGKRDFSVKTEIASEKFPKGKPLKKDADRSLLSVHDLSDQLGISVGTVCAMCADGMPFVKVGKETFFRDAEVQNWLSTRPCVRVDVPEVGEDGVAAGVDSFGVVVAGVLFALMAVGIIFGAVMAIIG